MPDESAEKKIIIDEDWKSRVEAEREADQVSKAAAEDTAEDTTEATAEGTAEGTGEDTDEKAETGKELPPIGPMPEASFEMLLTTLAAESMVALGQVANPITGEASVNLDQAKFFIDTLQILREKTTGNLTEQEASALQMLLGQLQMAFVSVKNQGSATSGATPDSQTAEDKPPIIQT
jgi:hypothetical protein